MASLVNAPAPMGAVPGGVRSAIPVALKSLMSPTAASPAREPKLTFPRYEFRQFQNFFGKSSKPSTFGSYLSYEVGSLPARYMMTQVGGEVSF